MAVDYYNVYNKGFVDLIFQKNKLLIFPMQLLSFTYATKNSSPGKKLVLSLGIHEGKLHCIKLNSIPIMKFVQLVKRIEDPVLIEEYENGLHNGKLSETYKRMKYALPLKKKTVGTRKRPFTI